MQAEGSALANEAGEQERRLLGHLVFFDEKFLKFVHDEQDSRHAFAGLFIAIAVDVGNTSDAELLTASAQLRIQALEYAQAELPFAFDGHDASVRHGIFGIRLELD